MAKVSFVSGELVMERFRLLERIGAGGMGVVYRAFDERLQREVAVKEIAADDPERVLREAQAAARLNHPGIVTVYELGRRNGHALLVSELVPGTTLGGLLAANTLSDREVAEIGADLCEALAHAHAHGVVHRDLKPENVIVREDDDAGRRAKLMDFGIARLAGAPTLTATGEVVGTLAYMAPEQADGRLAGPEADVYSLALTLYECWAGANPVSGPTPAVTVRRISEAVPSLREWRPDLPPGLTDAIDHCLEVDPATRPGPRQLRACIDAEIPTLDASLAVPPPATRPEPARDDLPALGMLRIGILVVVAAALALLAGPGGLPGAALVLAVLVAPALFLLPPSLAAVPLAAAPLGALGIVGIYPAAPGAILGGLYGRALAGALGWCWALCAAIALDMGSRLGIASSAETGWGSSTADAVSMVLVPLFDPASVLGVFVFAAAAAALGWILTAGHLALAALGALLWAAALSGLLGLVGDGSLGDRPLLLALTAAAAIAVEHARRAQGDLPAPPAMSLSRAGLSRRLDAASPADRAAA